MDIPDLTTFKRCSKCGEVKPRDAFSRDKYNPDGRQYKCKACANEYRAANRERRREYDREYRIANAEHIREYFAANRERKREYDREYNATNAEHIHARNREYGRKYRQTSAGKSINIAKSHRRRARKAGNGGTYTSEDLAAIRAAQTDRKGRLICWRCGKPIKDTPHLDHWQPLKHGGPNSAGNLHYMHWKCNLSKGTKLPTEIGRLL
jgi:5-methylcytosine-specific restriction endonuclease McrA